MIFRRVFIAIGCVLLSPLSQANSSLGEVNIELRGNVVDLPAPWWRATVTSRLT